MPAIATRDHKLPWLGRAGLLAALSASAVLFALALPQNAPVALARVQAQTSPAAGLLLFREKGCEHCHGANLQGTDKAPDLTGVGRRISRAEIENQIVNGGKEMPAFADALDTGELALLVDYLSQQKSKPHR